MNKKTGILTEFKEFISRGNVLDLAVGVIIGSSFTAIVNSLVKDMIMPVIGILLGGIDFSSLRYVITPATDTTAEAAICYGSFIQTVVNFLLVAFVLFLVIKTMNRFRKKKEEAPVSAKPSDEVMLLQEIRDLLQQKN